jgi:hypothetical protein
MQQKSNANAQDATIAKGREDHTFAANGASQTFKRMGLANVAVLD